MVACAQAHVAQARDCIVVLLIPRLRHMCLCAGNHNIGLPMVQFVFLQKKFPIAKDSASLFTRGIIKNIILSCFNFCVSSNWKEQIVFMKICKVK